VALPNNNLNHSGRVGWLGIDPGKMGGIAVVYRDDSIMVDAVPMPGTERDIYEAIARMNQKYQIAHAMIELVHASPIWSRSSSFKLGDNYGFCRGVVTSLGCPWELVSPTKWQRMMNSMSGGDKNITKAAAQRLFPEAKVTHMVADAILIAEFCRRTWIHRNRDLT